MKIKNKTRNIMIAENCIVADTFFSRLKGLLGKKSIDQDTALLITPCNSIHMFFMKFPIDVLFIDKNDIIVHMVNNIKPWRTSKIVRHSEKVIELPAGSLLKNGTCVGDELIFE